jgi:hypothetical protein
MDISEKSLSHNLMCDKVSFIQYYYKWNIIVIEDGVYIEYETKQ